MSAARRRRWVVERVRFVIGALGFERAGLLLGPQPASIRRIARGERVEALVLEYVERVLEGLTDDDIRRAYDDWPPGCGARPERDATGRVKDPVPEAVRVLLARLDLVSRAAWDVVENARDLGRDDCMYLIDNQYMKHLRNALDPDGES